MLRYEDNEEHWPQGAPWARRKTESQPAWAAFFTYLITPLAERSMTRAWRDFSGEKTNAPRRWWTWARVHHWQERVTEFEQWRAGKARLQEEAEQAEEVRKWDAIRAQERERGLNIGRALLEKAQAMLQFPLAEVEMVKSVYDDGREKEVQIFRPGGWNFGTVARMIEVGAKLVNLMSEMPTERRQLDLTLIYDEADKVAKKIGGGVTRQDVLAMAERIAQERDEALDAEGGPV